MADIAQTAPTSVESSATNGEDIKFSGSFRNLVPGMALIGAGLLAPVMGLTDVYFAAAMAWVFVIWGFLFVYVGLMDIYKSYEMTDDRMIISDPFRFWNHRKEWDWAHVIRMDIKVTKRDARIEDAMLQIYYDVPGEGDVEREDRDYDPEIAQAVIDHADLSPQSDDIEELTHLPFDVKGVYVWSK